MKLFNLGLAALLGQAMPAVGAKLAGRANPLQKVIELMSQLQMEVISDGEKETNAYRKYVQWCKESAFARQNELKDRMLKEEQLKAAIEKALTDQQDLASQIQDISGSLATDEADMKAVTLLREKEKVDFTALDDELEKALDTLKRAKRVLERELEGANVTRRLAFLQKPTQGMQLFTATLNEFQELVNAATVLSSDDRARLAALVQTGVAEGDEEDDDMVGAPAEIVYTSHSENIIDQLADLEDKLYQSQQSTRTKERDARHKNDLMKQDLGGKIQVQQDELDQAKKDLAGASGLEAESKKKLLSQQDIVKETRVDMEKLQHGCMQRATEYSEEVRTRKAEMTALAEAKKMIQDSSGGAQGATYSFLQVDEKTKAPARDLSQVGGAVVHELRELAKRTGELELTQLASRALTAIRIGISSSEGVKDPFAQVRRLIEQMIQRIQKAAQADLDHKEFCDREMGHTKEQKANKQDVVDEESTRVERVSAEVAKLEDEVKDFYREIAEITESQGELDKLRTVEHVNYVQTKKDLENGLTGVQTALKILRDYYGNAEGADGAASLAQEDVGASMDEVEADQQQQHQQASAAASGPNAGSGIIALLEVVESDFAKILTETQGTEDAAEEEHRRYMQDSNENRKLRESLAKRASNEITRLRKTAAELATDRSASQDELDAINEYLARLKAQCIAQPESSQERMKKREVEIAGLREALAALGSA